MNLNFKLGPKNIFMIIYVFFLIGNLVAVYYLSVFLRNNVYYTYFPDKDVSAVISAKRDDDLNMSKFDSIIENNEKKSTFVDFSQTRNLFY